MAGSEGGLMKGPQDILCGLMFIVIGAGGLWFGRDFPMGTAIRLGTGVFPAILCWGLIVIGGIVLVKGLVIAGPQVGHIAWRPVIMIAIAATAFAILIEPAGLMAAMVAMMILAALAGDTPSLREFTIFSVVMLAMGWAIFIVVLDMPIKVFPWS